MKPPTRAAFAFAAALAALCPLMSAAAVTNLLSVQFERSQGYDPAYELVGQKGWVGYGASSGGNGLVTNFLGSQAAYVGLFPLDPTNSSFLNVWRPINYTNGIVANPLIRFSVTLAIIDSTNNQWDDFYWSVYNAQGDRLLTIDFDNYYLVVNYALDGTNEFKPTGVAFATNVSYTLNLAMNFAANQWSADLSGAGLATNLPLTTAGAALNLGDIDAVWAVYAPATPGNNFMVFDNYLVTAEPVAVARASLTNWARASSGQFLFRVNGLAGARYAVDATTNLQQWVALKTNVATDGYFYFIDSAAPGFAKRFYRARLVP